MAMLTRDALRASADATHARLGGPGQWLLTMPAHHVAGVQVLVRSLLAAYPLEVDRHAAGYCSWTRPHVVRRLPRRLGSVAS